MYKLLGGLICLSPLSVALACLNFSHNPANFWQSISSTYYTNAGFFFVFILLFIAACLISTKKIDLSAAGFSLIGIVMFPCGDPFLGLDHTMHVGFFGLPMYMSDKIHLMFLMCLATCIFFHFIKTSLKYKTNFIDIIIFVISTASGIGIGWEQSVPGRVYHWTVLIFEILMFCSIGVYFILEDGKRKLTKCE